MVDPGPALLAFAALAATSAVVFWPKRGLAARILRVMRMSDRVRLEDALKHAYACERRGVPCTPESLAGQLGISPARAAGLISELAATGMVRTEASYPTLTDEGRAAALQLVRTHRLWEQYLADRTGVPAAEWHARAERMEHTLSPEEAERLATRLGHPAYDPHGDPIPTADGALPPVRGVPLNTVCAGDRVEIVHLEDEPHEIFDRLIAVGLAPGERLEVLAHTMGGVRVRGPGGEFEIEAMAARNVTVQPLAAEAAVAAPPDTLADAAPGETVRVLEISPVCQGAQRRRLLDLGVVRGTRITPELVSAPGDPVAYRIRGALIALRREQARWILVERPGARAEVA